MSAVISNITHLSAVTPTVTEVHDGKAIRDSDYYYALDSDTARKRDSEI